MAYIEKVTIVAQLKLQLMLSVDSSDAGTLGWWSNWRCIFRELLKTDKHAVTAMTRKESKTALPKGVKVAVVDFDHDQSLISALSGAHFLIITLSITASGDIHAKLVKAAGEADVPYVMPNIYRADTSGVIVRTNLLWKKV